MKRDILLVVLFLFFTLNLFAQEQVIKQEAELQKMSVGHELSLIIASKVKLPKVEPQEPVPSKWSGGTLLQLGFSQLALSNWASGGYDNVALNAYVNIYRNYNVLDDMFWENRLQVGYGFTQSFGDRYKKNDDKFIYDSKLGYRAIKNFFAAVTFNLRTQMTNGYSYPVNKDPILISAPFAPAYFSLGVGMDYKPFKPLSINFSPLTGNLVVVTKENLRARYGNKPDQSAKLELGAQLKIDYKHQINKMLNITSTLNLFSDYLGKPTNIKTLWDLLIDAKINKYFSTSLRTNLIYDNDILIADKQGTMAPRIQLKEIFQVGFSYTFGEFKK